MSLDGNYDAPRPTLSPEAQAKINKLRQKNKQAGGTNIKYGANCGSTPKYAIQFPSTPTAPSTPTSIPKYGLNLGSTSTTPTTPTTPTSTPKYGLNVGGSTSTPKYGLNCGVRGK